MPLRTPASPASPSATPPEPPPQRWRRRLGRAAWLLPLGALALLAAAVGAITVAWMLRAGPEAGLTAMARLLRHGPTTVDDFRVYPARALAPAPVPRPFARAAGPAAPPAVPVAGGRQPLPTLLAASDTLDLVVVRDDRIVFDWQAPGHAPGTPSMWFSVSKTLTVALLQAALADGLVASADQPVTDFVPELAAQGLSALTLRHLADMRSGIDYTENDNPFGLHVLLNYTPDLPAMLRRLRPAAAPGGDFVYRSGDTALLALALQRALGGESLTAWAQRRLWTPLGMEDAGVWSLDREGGLEKAWCCIAGSARDLAKLGRLVLAGGAPLLPPAQSAGWTTLPRGDGGRRAYAGGWWPPGGDGDDLLAMGKDGQFLYVDPSSHTVVVRLGRDAGGMGLSAWSAVFRALARHPW